MLSQERIPAFLDKWIQSHIAAGANLTTGSKPIMFEEFGKKLEPAQQTAFMIEQLRDPVYTSTYASVEKAINASQPIAGSMFWKLAIGVFDRQDPRGKCALAVSPASHRAWQFCTVAQRTAACSTERSLPAVLAVRILRCGCRLAVLRDTHT
jgi:hypothetical protein